MLFNSVVLLSLLSLSALAVPYSNPPYHHRAIAARYSAHNPGAPFPHVGKKRSLTKRCKTRNPPVASSSKAPEPTSSSSQKPEPTREAAPKPDPTPSPEPKPTTTSSKHTSAPRPTATSSKHTSAPQPTSGSGSGGGSNEDDNSGLFFSLHDFNTGQGTFYNTGLTACGGTFQDTDYIAAVSFQLFDAFPGATANPNENRICGKKIEATYEGKTVTVAIQDRCGGCNTNKDIDFTPAAFRQLADESVGRLYGLKWKFV